VSAWCSPGQDDVTSGKSVNGSANYRQLPSIEGGDAMDAEAVRRWR